MAIFQSQHLIKSPQIAFSDKISTHTDPYGKKA